MSFTDIFKNPNLQAPVRTDELLHVHYGFSILEFL
jgi:hypothetical protein